MSAPVAGRPQSRDPSLGVPAQLLHRPYIKLEGERWEDTRPRLQPNPRRQTETAASFPSIGTSSSARSGPAQSPDTVPITRMSAEEALRLPQLQGTVPEEVDCIHWKRMRGGVQVQVTGISIHTAARRGMIEATQALIEEGIKYNDSPVDARDKEQMTALHYASKIGNMAMVELLISYSAQVNLQSVTGWTPLAIACDKGHLDVCRRLIKANAKVDQDAQHGVTPLQRAAKRGYEDLVNLFVRNGADFARADDLVGFSAVHHAAAEGHASILMFFVGESRARLDHVTKWGETVLHLGAAGGHAAIVALALKFGCTQRWRTEFVNRQNSRNGNTAMHEAAARNHTEVLRLLLCTAVADLDRPNLVGQTALHMAVAHGHLQTARMLLDAGAASLPDVDGRIPPQINHCSRSQYDKFTLLPLGESLGPPIAPPRPGPATASPSGCPPTCGNQTQETDGSHRAHSAHARESRRRASGLCSDDKVDKVDWGGEHTCRPDKQSAGDDVGVGARTGGRTRGKEQEGAAAAGGVPVDPGQVSEDDCAGAGGEERFEWEQVGRAALEQLLRSMSRNCEQELVNVVAAAVPAPASWREDIMAHRLALLGGREGQSVREQQRLEEVSKQREQAAAAAEYERRVQRVRQKKHEEEMKVVAADVARNHACRVICGAFALLKRRREHEREEAQRALAASKLEANRRRELRAREMDAAAAAAAAATGAATSAAAQQFEGGAEGLG